MAKPHPDATVESELKVVSNPLQLTFAIQTNTPVW
jgi:hypothetical protein